jgi:hypothetical protein
MVLSNTRSFCVVARYNVLKLLSFMASGREDLASSFGVRLGEQTSEMVYCICKIRVLPPEHFVKNS